MSVRSKLLQGLRREVVGARICQDSAVRQMQGFWKGVFYAGNKGMSCPGLQEFQKSYQRGAR
jgi:hypothetical protein